ncbi:MAG: hypothetical protein K0S27_466 [Gammaproteobacteria bacterium]|nr:hypothetical protein [Gammaproteobacteria bacterium]
MTKKIGAAQGQLPAHAINEYCRDDRSFDPAPNFFQREALPRMREVWVDEGEGPQVSSHVFTAKYNGGSIGETCVLYKGQRSRAMLLRCQKGFSYPHSSHCALDRKAMSALFEARLGQQQYVMRDLLKDKPIPAKKR